MAHPLCGANLGTLATVAGRSGLPSDIGGAAMIAASALARWPVSAIEKIAIENSLVSQGDMPPPVFILGHWRSGTTHLYNIMCQSGQWGFVPPVATGLPWDLFGIAKVFNPLLERALPEHRYIDNIPVNPDSPQEDEIAIANMSEVSFYHAIYFPRHFAANVNRGLFFDGCSVADIRGWRRQFSYFLRKLYKHQGDKRLLIKNPVYTARPAMLREMYPGAKFVHIHRNPYDVFVSMQNFYKKLLKELALQNYDHVDIDETILSVYDRMMRIYEAETAGWGGDELIELRYDDLDADPIATIEEVYGALALPGFGLAKPRFENYLASVKSFKKNKFDYSEETAKRVEARLGYFIEKWGYERPGADASGVEDAFAESVLDTAKGARHGEDAA